MNINFVYFVVYLLFYYKFLPTTDDYSTSLGAAATVSRIVIGVMAVAQYFSSVYFSAW